MFNYVDPTGRLDNILYPNSQVTNFDYYGETDDFRLKEIENLEPGVDPDALSVFEYAYTSTGMIETWKQQAGTASPNTWTFDYDRAHQLTGAVLRDSSQSIIESFGYGYDRVGNRTHERHAQGALDDSPGSGAIYNELNQMTGRSEAGAIRFQGEIDQGGIVWVDGQQAEMAVDDSGQEPVMTFETWLSLEPGTRQVEIEAVNPEGLSSARTYELTVTAQGEEILEYDLAGNLVKRTAGSDVTEYHWDAENRLVEIEHPDGTTTEFTYDGFGRRVRLHEKNSSGGTLENRTFVWDGLRIAEERNATGATVQKRFYSMGVREGTSNYFYTFDHLGSIREVVDAGGTPVTRYDYDPYGRVGETNLSGNVSADFRFTGHFYHEKSGLHLAPYRAYDADLGRWLNRDPLFMAELLPEGPALYGYGNNSPTNYIDILGLDVVYIVDNSSRLALGLGHGAVLIGNDRTSWKYFSFSPRGMDVREYPDIQSALDCEEIQRYDTATFWRTTLEQDAAAIEAGLELVGRRYDLTRFHCGHAAAQIVSAAGIVSGMGNAYAPRMMQRHANSTRPFDPRLLPRLHKTK